MHEPETPRGAVNELGKVSLGGADLRLCRLVEVRFAGGGM